MPNKTAEFFTEHGSDAVLPPADMASLLLGGDLPEQPVDPNAVPTDPPAEPAKEPEKLPDEPAAADKDPDPPAKEPEKLPADKDPDSVILAKDGKHVIEYEKLVEARDNAKKFKDDLGVSNDRILKLEETIATLTAPKEDPADAEAARVQAEEATASIEDLKVNDPEVYKAVEVMLATQLKTLTDKFEGMIQPLQESTNDSATDIHFQEIAAAHEDYDAVVTGDDFTKWVDGHWNKDSLNNILDKGNSSQVVGMISEFKNTQPAVPAPDPDAEALAAKETEEKANAAANAALEKKGVPNSLSEVAASSKAHHDPNEALMLKTPKDMVTVFSGKASSADILESMDKLL